MDVKQMKQNKLKRILQFSIPSIIAMLLQTIITVTDGFYTGNYVGEQALAAVNLGLPILYFYLGGRALYRSWRLCNQWQNDWCKAEGKIR